jgi:hypothetical protein
MNPEKPLTPHMKMKSIPSVLIASNNQRRMRHPLKE